MNGADHDALLQVQGVLPSQSNDHQKLRSCLRNAHRDRHGE